MKPLEITVIDDELMLLLEIARVLGEDVEPRIGREVTVHAFETLEESKKVEGNRKYGESSQKLIIMDLFLKEPENGFFEMRRGNLRERYDGVIAMSRLDRLPILRSLLNQGFCHAYIPKRGGSLDEMVEAVVCLGTGSRYRNKTMLAALECREPDPFERLSALEIQILQLTHVEQLHPKGIATLLDCEPKTVYSNRARAHRKLGTNVDREVYMMLVLHGYAS